MSGAAGGAAAGLLIMGERHEERMRNLRKRGYIFKKIRRPEGVKQFNLEYAKKRRGENMIDVGLTGMKRGRIFLHKKHFKREIEIPKNAELYNVQRDYPLVGENFHVIFKPERLRKVI